MDLEKARFNMIEQQIRPWDVLDPSVLELLMLVKREDFVPPEHRALAFVDTDIPLPEGQAMLSPKVEARLVQEVAACRHERVLVIGAGGAYMAALLGHRAHSVVLVQPEATVHNQTRAALTQAHAANVQAVQADGAQGLKSQAPFDLIVLAGSVAAVPNVLFDQLKTGGRLAAVVGQLPVMQAVLFTKGPQSIQSKVLFDTVAPRLTGFTEPSRFQF
jgi:protein-L-isoaspartate(D-aspartate) O-methyltransferase